MSHDALIEQPSNITHDFSSTGEVQFDPERLTIIGLYSDELSAQRAKKGWKAALTQGFLLDPQDDLGFATLHDPNHNSYILRCQFESACARYAFWRLINSQAPEAQYAIETAHIPLCEARHADFMSAPDMRSIKDATTGLQSVINKMSESSSLLRTIKRILGSGKTPG